MKNGKWIEVERANKNTGYPIDKRIKIIGNIGEYKNGKKYG